MKFEVLHTQWAADGEIFAGGAHEITSPSKAFLALFAGAEAAGSVVLLDASEQQKATITKSVQSQEDGEAAYAAAQASGDWHEGNIAQFDLDVASGARDGAL